MYILGISCFYHDSSAALMKDGVVVAAAEEERFTRVKHDPSFPVNAVNYCLKSQNITIQEIDYVGFYEKPLIKFERLMSQHLDAFPKSYRIFLKTTASWITDKLRVMDHIRKKLKYRKDVMFIDHHMAHAASAFLVSPFEDAAILTVDGVGEWTTASYGIGEKCGIIMKREIAFPHSIGLLYSTITAYLGFSVNNSEYKVMGLSGYGNLDRRSNRYYPLLKKVVDVKEDGSFRLDMRYFSYSHSDRMPSARMWKLLGGPSRKRQENLTKRHHDIASALQMLTEDILLKMLLQVHRDTKKDSLVMAGGVALNSVLNGKILKNTPFKRVWIQPNSSDGGTSLGVCAFIDSCLLKNGRRYMMKDAYLGPEFSHDDIKGYLDANHIRYSHFSNEDDLVKTTAKLIFENHVVGWFQGRMEFGPRALGARSILSNPCNKDMKEILNVKVKHRESFRPFAPVVCQEDADIYFECDMPLPDPADFMLMVYPVRKRWQGKLPCITHVDGSGRLQTIKKEQNQRYYRLIHEFGSLSGIPILVNTSFNIRGEPIVCSPHDAYRCMMGTGIDYIVMGDFLIKRSDNLKDAWNSEASAND
jgi:carbamoyltransferase